MSSRIVRRAAVALLLTSLTVLAPSPSLALSRRGPDGPACTEVVRSFFAFLVQLFDLASEGSDTGGAMDPNGSH